MREGVAPPTIKDTCSIGYNETFSGGNRDNPFPREEKGITMDVTACCFEGTYSKSAMEKSIASVTIGLMGTKLVPRSYGAAM